jgi:ribosomal protein S1
MPLLVLQRLRVSVVLADRKSKKIFFSMKPKESEELIQKKKSLMAKLNVGDIVECTIKRFVYFGIFVEVEGVPALIQQWEVSWDETLDPSVSYKIGQVVDAKVIQLDYNNNRIFLSLKDVKVPGGLSPFPSWWFSLLNC